MVPLRDDNPTKITPYVTYCLIAINILVFLYELSLSPQELEQFFRTYAIFPRELTASFGRTNVGEMIPELMTLVTSQFLPVGFLHLGSNMLFLFIFGNNIEEQLGRIKYLIFYLACGVLAGLVQWFFSPHSNIPALGASGAIAGVIGAYILRFPRVQIPMLLPLGFFITTARILAILFLDFWFVQQVFYAIVSPQALTNIGTEGGGVPYWPHAVGFVFGAILGPLFGLFSSRER